MGRVSLAAAAAVLAVASTAAAGTPMPLSLGRAQGRGSVTIGAPTTRLHGRMWVHRLGGVGVARGRAEVSCRSRSGGDVEWFRFGLRPNARQELWRRLGGGACTVTVTLRGAGLLRVELRGY